MSTDLIRDAIRAELIAWGDALERIPVESLTSDLTAAVERALTASRPTDAPRPSALGALDL